MSNFRALGGVSESLRTLLLDRMEFLVPPPQGFRVSIGPPRPDSSVNVEAAEAARINLFLYRVDENAGLKNQQIPGLGNSSAYGNPPLSLDLHYLVTAYGTTAQAQFFDETLAHFLLGSAMRVFHDFPIITEDLRTARPPLGQTILHDAMRGEFERIKVTMEPVSLEDISKVWTALTLPFRVSAAYAVNVVQIESTRSQAYPRRVQPAPGGGARIHVVPMQTPRIRELRVRWAGDPPGTERTAQYASIGDTLILLGENMASPASILRFENLELPLGATFNSSRMEVVIPDANRPDGSAIPEDLRLQPGVQTVSVVNGVPELPATGFPSNQAAFMLVPRVDTVMANLVATPRTVTINGSRLSHVSVPGETLVGRAVVPRDLYGTPSQAQIVVPVPDTLVAWRVHTLVSGPLAVMPPGLNNPAATLSVTIAGVTPPDFVLPRQPADFKDLASLLESRLRTVSPNPGFAGARVTVTSANEIVIVPGGLHDSVSVANAGGGSMLRLSTAQGAVSENVYQSGRIADPPGITALTPRLRVSVNAAPPVGIALASRPVNLAQTTQMLETAIRANPLWVKAWVASTNNQLLLRFPDGPVNIEFTADPADALTVRELDLIRDAVVRVRVNGAESLREVLVRLTE